MESNYLNGLSWIKCSDKKQIIVYFQRPDKWKFPLHPQDLEVFKWELEKQLPSDIKFFFKRALLTHTLLNNNYPGLIRWAKKNLNWPRLISGLSGDTIEKSNWTNVLIPVTTPTEPRIISLIVGFLPGSIPVFCPKWAINIFSHNSIQHLKRTIDLILEFTGSDNSVYIFPLLEPDARIEGGSFCLGVALGLLSLIKKQPIYKKLIATGNIFLSDGNICVGDVGDIEEKYKIVKFEGFSIFIVPYSQSHLIKRENNTLPEVVGVNDLEQAWMWARFYDKTNSDELRRMELLYTPKGFVDNCLSVTKDKLYWFVNEQIKQDLVNDIISDDSLCNSYLQKLHLCYQNRDKERLSLLLDLNIDVKKLEDLNKIYAFSWYVYKFKIATDRGLLDESNKWSNYAKRFLKYAEITHKDLVVSFINSYFVHERHNRYKFFPDIPEEVKIYIEKLKVLEPNIELGKLYGTIAQNYGFCGPKYLNEVEHYVKLAQKNFGDGEIKESQLYKEWQREFSVLTYAYLDAGRIEDAKKCLWKYLNIEGWEIEKIEYFCKNYEDYAYQHVLIMRYLADAVGYSMFEKEIDFLFDQLRDKFLSIFNQIKLKKVTHPWQLWTYNLGRILAVRGDRELAKEAWKVAINICLSGGETMQVMSLLALSALFNYNLYEREEEVILDKIISLLKSPHTFLEKKHFEKLVMFKDKKDVLRLVYKESKIFFPFSYR